MSLWRLAALALGLGAAMPSGAQDGVRERLNASPRHHEWVQVESDGRDLHCFVVYPEVSERALAVLVIHENKGLSDWVRGVCDQLAERGYIAIAPDLLSGMGPNGGKTSDFPDSNAARDALYQLDQDRTDRDLDRTAAYVAGLPAANGNVAVAGFCWGGHQTWRFATRKPDLAAAFVFYGTPPENKDDVARIRCPVYGFYGGNDARVNASLPDIEAWTTELEKAFEPVVYDGAGHGFMRAGEEPDADAANRTARDAGWKRWADILQTL